MNRISTVLALFTVLSATSALADDELRFNLTCREFDNPRTLSERIDHRFSIDLERREVCRAGHVSCWPLTDHGRWLDLSYDFQDGERPWVMFRLYDRQTGWLDQVMQPEGQQPVPYGDALCERQPFARLSPAP